MSKISAIISNIKKKVDSSVNIKNSIIFTAFAFLNNGVSFLLILILANFLSQDSYGTLNLFNTTILIISVLIPLGTSGYIGNSFFIKELQEFQKILSSILSIGMFTFTCFLLIACVVGNKISVLLGIPLEFQIIILVICFTQFVSTINLELWRLREQSLKYGLYTMGTVILNCTLTAYFVIGLNLDWEGRVYAQLIVSIIFFILSLFILFRINIFKFRSYNFKIIKEVLIFGLPLIPHMLTGWMRQGIDRYIINYFHSADYVGLFSFPLNFSNIILIIGTAFNAANSVHIYKILSQNQLDTKTLDSQIRRMILFFLLISAIILIISHLFIKTAFLKYSESLPLLFPLCLSATFQSIYLLYVNYLFYYRKTNILMLITVSVSIIHILLSFALTTKSILYTAYINLFSNFVICILVGYYATKLKRRNN